MTSTSSARGSAPGVPDREGAALLWVQADLDPAALQKQGWSVYSFRDLRDQYISPARSRGAARTSLHNPAKPLLDLLGATKAFAVVGVSLRTAADLRDLYGFVIEPAYRRELKLLVSSDRDLDELEPDTFVDPVGYSWTLERLRHVAVRFRLGPSPDGLPPMTPIEALLYQAMRKLGLAPVAQYGIGPYRADFAIPEWRLVIECDGRQWHDPDRDRRRDAVLRRKGWEPLHFGGSEITRDPVACAARVMREVATRRGTAESDQPEIAIPVHRSWWSRLMAWLRLRFAASDEASALPLEQVVGDEPSASPAWVGDLDPEQRSAVMSHDGVVQVIAPAGSGKTTVLVARVRELVARGVPPNRILCCTFNAAAAIELQSRLDQAGVDGIDAATFHAVGRRILKRAGGLRGDPLTMSYGQWRRLAKLAMDGTTEGVWIEAPEAKEQISSLKLGRMVTVEEFAEVAATPAERTLASLYRLYEAELAEQGRSDFDDFIFQAVRLLQRDAEVRHHWQGEYTAVLVDEYQDIEPAQELLIQILAAPEDLLLCVGDEDQCLYAWRRASVERVIELDQLYPGLERHALARNYRCPVRVVDASRSLIARNRRRFPKQILPGRAAPGEITLAGATDLQAQAAHAARLVRDLDQGQAVVLARTGRVLSEIAIGLAQAGIRFFGPERIKRRTGEPAVILSYVRLLGSPMQARPEDVDTVFRVPNRFLPDEAELNVASGLRSGLSFGQSVARLRTGEDWRRERLAEGARLFDELANVRDAAELIHRLRTEGGLDRHYADSERFNPTDQSAIDTLAAAEATATGMGVVEFAEALDYQATIIEQHFDTKGIELSTIHGAKGRQWPLVVVAGMDERELPHARSLSGGSDPEGELEGERRLAYVALTRTSDRLVLLHSSDQPSRFIAEAALAIEPSPVGSAPMPPPKDGSSSTPPSTSRSTQPRFVIDDLALPSQAAPPSLSQPRPPAEAPRPVALMPTAERAGDGSIPCSLPGCTGRVAAAFVCETSGAFVGLCPRFEIHEAIAMNDPACEAIWVELKMLSDAARRAWRSATVGPSADGTPCSLPGCGGLVNARYLFELDGQVRGLCPQRVLHQALARRDAAVKAELRRLETANRRNWSQATADGGLDTRAQLLAEGGIPCAVPGCDGVVGASYVVDSPDGGVGVCGLGVVHARLAEDDPAVRTELGRLLSLTGRGSRGPGVTRANRHDETIDVDVEDLPF